MLFRSFQGVKANGALFAEVKEAVDLPFATSVALELQRRGGLGKYTTRKNQLEQGNMLRLEEMPETNAQGRPS